MRVAIYARCSKSDESQDPENQLRPLREFAKTRGYEIVAEYVDYASGAKSDREQFQQMLKDADQRKFDLVLFWATDRFSREGIKNTLSYIERLKHNGIAIKSLQESWLDTRDNGMGQLLIAIFSWLAAQEKKRISERTKAKLSDYKRQIKKQGYFITKNGEKKTSLGRKEGTTFRNYAKSKYHSYWASEKGQARRERMRRVMKDKWSERRKNNQMEMGYNAFGKN